MRFRIQAINRFMRKPLVIVEYLDSHEVDAMNGGMDYFWRPATLGDISENKIKLSKEGRDNDGE